MKTSIMKMVSKNDRINKVATCSIIVLCLSVLIVGGLTGKSLGASEQERVAKLIEGAKLEGKVHVYTGQNIQDTITITKKFEEKYPFIKVEVYRATPAKILNKVLIEAKAGVYVPDVLIMNGMNATIIKEQGLYASYVSPESQAYQERFKDPDGKWNSISMTPWLIGFNTKLLSRKDIPDTYEGFLNPRWKGKKIGFEKDLAQTEWFATMLKIMGEKKGMDFFRKFAAQELAYRNGLTLINELIIAGEFPVGTVLLAAVEDKKKKGAPVDWMGVSPVITKLNTTGLAAHASHPNAGKLFIDFQLSREGQMIVANMGRLIARIDIETDVFKAFKGIKLYPSDTSIARQYNEYSKQFTEVFGLR